MILLARHALALPRDSWPGAADRRPLSPRGERQASGLVDVLAPYTFGRIISSPSLRCKATVAPLALARDMPVKTSKSLREGGGDRALDLVLDAVEDLVVCTHGDVMTFVLAGLRHLGWPIPARPAHAKGSTWVLSPREAGVYLPPPDRESSPDP